MARQKKEGVYANFYLEKRLSEQLEEYCMETDRTKTSVVERALREYFEKHLLLNECTDDANN